MATSFWKLDRPEVVVLLKRTESDRSLSLLIRKTEVDGVPGVRLGVSVGEVSRRFTDGDFARWFEFASGEPVVMTVSEDGALSAKPSRPRIKSSAVSAVEPFQIGQFDTKILSAAVARASRIAPRKSYGASALACVRFESAPNGTRLISTNLDTFWSETLPFTVEAVDGLLPILVNCSELVRALRGAGRAKTVHLSTAGTFNLRVKAGPIQAIVPGSSPEEFPPLPEVPESHRTLDGEVFNRLVRQSAYACSTDYSRSEQQGVVIESTVPAGSLKFVATNGHRMAVAAQSIGDVPREAEPGIWPIILGPSLSLIAGMVDPKRPVSFTLQPILPSVPSKKSRKKARSEAGDEQEDAPVTVPGRFLSFSQPGWEIVVRRTDGTFPPYLQAFPSPDGLRAEAVVRVGELREAVRSAWPMTNEATRGVLFTIGPKQVRVQLLGRCEGRKYRVDVEVQNFKRVYAEGEPEGRRQLTVFSLNGLYLDQYLAGLPPNDLLVIKRFNAVECTQFHHAEADGLIMGLRLGGQR